jgi:uncharacterized membrane protein YoaK (UPF0700 family)
MGVQSAGARPLEASGIATTYITGTLTNLMIRIGNLRQREAWAIFETERSSGCNSTAQAHSNHSTGLLAAVWSIYLVGAARVAAGALVAYRLTFVFPVIALASVTSTAGVCFGAPLTKREERTG